MTGVTAERIIEVYPRLYHMAHIDSWLSIAEHGLRSTIALLDLYEVENAQRIQLEQRHRPECVRLEHSRYSGAVIRDQKPMSDAGLLRCLSDDLSPSDWYQLLNRHVFFWPTEQRLHKMMGARAYNNDSHAIVIVDTASLLACHFDRVLLSHMNSGCTVPYPHPRGATTFRPPDRFPFETRKRSSGEGFAELLVEYTVADIVDHTVEVYVGRRRDRFDTIWSREGTG